MRPGDDGTVRFPPIRTSELSLKVLDAEPATDIAFDGSASFVPVGVSEIRLVGLPFVPVLLSSDERTTPCGGGPRIRINSTTYETRVTASPAELYGGGTGRAELCGAEDVDLRRGCATRSRSRAATAFVVDTLVLGDGTRPDGGGGRLLDDGFTHPAPHRSSPARARTSSPG